MIVLHHCHQTRSMRTLWLLNELDLAFSLRVHAFDRSLREPEYLSLSPAGRVPALELDGEVYFETGAIAEILCERFPERGLGRPPGDIDRPDFLVWLHFAETVTQHAAALTQQHVALYEDEMRSPLIMRLEAARLRKCYAAIEGRLSTPVENRDYLLTSGFSAADIAVGQAVYMARHFAQIDEFPETARWYDRITERESFQDALPPQGAELLFERDFYPAWD
ncbi:glutathione S-transferase [Palleronia marisminoris]|uniref:Glutathionine S-transferase n=1 Tax=Palleronia marisminoris TaxID=315423 RepID=A0A1Y5TAV6_9RHOB|nr:glutathione S-transferase family protein [Palleronia marisminoris]SFH35200.1 glutathione S-transferase [Palleronia marisminoris]SLN59395.1 glutathionine S-transferase [Palleronia marisminoris]